MSCKDNSELIATDYDDAMHSLFKLIPAGDGKIDIKSVNNDMYIHVNSEGTAFC